MISVGTRAVTRMCSHSSFYSSALIWWNWTTVTTWIELLWVPPNRNPARPPLFVHRFGFIARLPNLTIGIISPVWDGQFISRINIYNLLLSEFILGDGSILSTSQISWSYLCRLWNEFPPKNVSGFFFVFFCAHLLPLRNQCVRLCALIWPLMTANLYLLVGEQQWAADTVSHQNKESSLCGLQEIHGAVMCQHGH